MGYYFTDAEINNLVAEEKSHPVTLSEIMAFKQSDGHKRSSFEINRPDGSRFIIKLRQNQNNINDFSAIIGFQEKGNNTSFILRRYNGKSHEHSNRIEGNKFYYFHIHIATQRYQDDGRKEESYAEESDQYTDLTSALRCLLAECNIKIKTNPQESLFNEF